MEANLFLTNIDPEVTEKELENALKDSGTILASKLEIDPNNNLTKRGYV